jgi:L-fuconolactonase
MKIDSHQHFWIYSPAEYDWIPDNCIRKDFLPANLEPILKANDFDGCIAVQARQSEIETEWLLELATQNDIIKGVVGWVDLRADDLDGRLDYFSQFKKLKAYRHVVQAEPDDRFLMKEKFLRGISKLCQRNIPYDILIFAKHLPVTLEFVKQFPNHDFVIDHIAKPNIKYKEFSEWSKGLESFKNLPNVRCKLSGMVTETHFNEWQEKDFLPYLEVCLEVFGAERLMIGSDWPVCLLSGQYQSVMNIVKGFISRLSMDEQEYVLGKTATEFYKL